MSKRIKIKNHEGKVLEVYEKAYEVVYKNAGYHQVKHNEDPKNNGSENDTKKIAEMTEEELKKVTNDDLKAYLDEQEIDYKSSANKDELIDLIVGE